MKNTFCLVVLGLFSFCHSDTAFGEAAYENSGVVSFYGTYEYPTEESTTATSNSSTTTEPTKPADGGASSVLSSGVYGSRQGRLPATGTTNQAPFIYLGISLITIGILFIKRRREDENSISSSRDCRI